MSGLRPALVLVCLFLSCGSVAAQTGGIAIAVAGPDGTPLQGATVTLSHDAGFIKTTAELTAADGTVRFPVLRPGTGYEIHVSYPGYGPIRQTDIRVRIDDVQRLSIRMLDEISERVRVSAKRDVIDLETTRTATVFSDEFVSDLPVAGRSYQNILTLTAGVQDSDDDGNPNVHGSRTRDFRAEVSGISNVDPLTGQWMSRINPNSIEEIEVIAAGAGVEFGRAQGGFARIIQKQGSNEHEGVAEFLWRTTQLDGQSNRLTNLQAPDLDWQQPAIHASGPLLKDRLWYRFSHEYRFLEEPIGNGTIDVTTTDGGNHSDQITWQASPRNKLALLYQSDPIDVDNFDASFNIPGPASKRLKRRGGTYSLTWTAPYSPKIFVESQLAWQNLETGRFPMTLGVKNDCVSGTIFLEDAHCIDVDTNRSSGSYFRTEDDRRQRLTLRTRATLYAGKLWGADHQFKLGFSIENERYFRKLIRSPSLDFQLISPGSIDPTQPVDAASLESFGVGFLQIAVPQSDDVRATGTNWSIYAEDQLKPLSNLTVKLGVRIDHEEINSEGHVPLEPVEELADFVEGQQQFALANPIQFAFFSGILAKEIFTGYEALDEFIFEVSDALCENEPIETQGFCRAQVLTFTNTQALRRAVNVRKDQSIQLLNTNFSPAVSVAWSPGNNGKTALKAAFGRHYNTIPLIVPLQELEPGLTNLLYRIDLSSGLPVRLSGSSPTVSVRGVDRGLRTPYQDEVTLALERELWDETSLRLTYIRRKFRDQIQDTNVNLATADYGRCFRQDSVGDPTVVVSPGSGQKLVDAYTGEFYIDENPGDGDGRIDDCVGDNTFVVTDLQFIAQRPDDVPDLYVQNPLWGDVFEIGNSNSIDYTAYVLELTRRQYRNWELQTSYTWSESIGDGEDFFQELGNDPSLRDDVRGYQSYDQRHVVKLNATTITPWGVRLGTAISWQSGLPYSELIETPGFDALPPFLDFIRSGSGRPRQRYLGREGPLARNSGRNEGFWNIDLKATREITIGRRANLQISAEIFNALDDQTFSIYDPTTESGEILNGNRDSFVRTGRQWQVGMKLAF